MISLASKFRMPSGSHEIAILVVLQSVAGSAGPPPVEGPTLRVPKRPPDGFAAACALEAAFLTCLTGAGVFCEPKIFVPADDTLRAACLAGAGGLIRCVPSAGFCSNTAPCVNLYCHYHVLGPGSILRQSNTALFGCCW